MRRLMLAVPIVFGLAVPRGGASQTEAERCSAAGLVDLEEMAWALAPTLWFAPGEEHYPTLPFFTAFDGQDNDRDSLLDFHDLDEVLPRDSATDRGSWRALDSIYAEAGGSDRASPWRDLPPASAVMYRTRTLDRGEVRRFWRFLASDLQAWDRMDLEEVRRGFERGCPQIGVLEYYFYYLDDFGLSGHDEDIEFVFIFLPLDTESAPFRVTVGAGHDNRTPNNVLFEPRLGAEGPFILVELGGHGSSPDVDPTSIFQPGVDVNVHAAEAWGTRDQLALTGDGYTGRYRSEFTLQGRDRGLQLYPAHRDPTDLRGESGYSLVSVDEFLALDRGIELQDRDSVRAALVALSRSIPFFDPSGIPEVLGGELMTTLSGWRESLCCGLRSNDLAPTHRQVWNHAHFRERASSILKSHLYRPSLAQLKQEPKLWLDQLVISGITSLSGLVGVAGGVVVPVFSVGGLYTPGFITLEAGVTREFTVPASTGGFYFAGILDSSFREWLGWYGAVRRHGARQKTRGGGCEVSIPCEVLGPVWELSGGLSVLANSKSDVTSWDLLRRLRFRLGLTIPMAYRRNARSPTLEFQIVLR